MGVNCFFVTDCASMLNAVDLFTGIGGFTLAFEGVCKPLLYCDVNPMIQNALKSMMASKKLPKADVIDDVRNLVAIKSCVGSTRVDVLTASFPCQGWSLAGKKAGINDERSALFFDTVKVIEQLSPALVMFENVPGILTEHGGKDFDRIIKAMHAAGYSCRWTTCSAYEVGLPQKRTRWFCLCTNNKIEKMGKLPRIKLSVMTNGSAPNLIRKREEDYEARYFMLGNSIVPRAAQLAFARMYSGFNVTTDKQLRQTKVLEFKEISDTSSSDPVNRQHGYSSGLTSKKYVFVQPENLMANYKILLDPHHYTPEHVPIKRQIRSQPITHPVVIKMWPTPRSNCPGHCNRLSQRNMGDLATAALFASKIDKKDLQKSSKKGYTVNPRFVEWLMGFPRDHTKV